MAESMIQRRVFVALCAAHVAAAENSTDTETEAGDYRVDVSVAATLLAAFSFMLLVLYMTNSRDKDIRKNTYEVLSMTISVFCAVLVFQAVNAMVEAVVKVHVPARFEFIVDFLHMLCWFLVLQGSLTKFTGNLANVSDLAGIDNELADKLFAIADYRDLTGNAEIDDLRLLMDVKCFSALFAHATAFAAINAWGTLQHMSPFSDHPAKAMLVVPIAYLCQFVWMHCANLVRGWTLMAGSKDEKEKNRKIIWDDSAEEAENDIMGMAMSFLCVQAVRFVLDGHLPNNEGVAQEVVVYYVAHAVMLVICGVLSSIAGVFAYLLATQGDLSQESTGGDAGGLLDLRRHTMIGQTAMFMAQAWCFFYGMLYLFVSGGWEDHAVLYVIVALSVSILGFAASYVLDKIADRFRAASKETKNSAVSLLEDTKNKAVRRSISGLGLLVGFAWEQCFDKAAETIAKHSGYPDTVTLVALALFCSFLLIPAWKWYVLPYAITKDWLEMGGIIVSQMHGAELGEIRDGIDKRIRERRAKGISVRPEDHRSW